MATFAAFGSFATLLLSSFGGTVRDRLRAHLGLALAGSVLLTIGTLVSGSVAARHARHAARSRSSCSTRACSARTPPPGAIGAMLAYVLPVASPGTVAMIPDRLAGWWLASVAGTAAALAIAPRARREAAPRGAPEQRRAIADGDAGRGRRTARPCSSRSNAASPPSTT